MANTAPVTVADVFLAERVLLRRVVAGMGLRAGDADDVLQTVSVKCLKQAGSFADRQQGLRWLIRVTANECITEHRRRRRFRKQVTAIIKHMARPAVGCPIENAVSSEQLEAVQEALRALDDEWLKPLVLRYFCDLSSAEIGEILGLPASTVRSLLCRGRMALARALMKRGVER
jgi:RNA polymerase sigma factor (sigma-70 family)